MAPLVKINAFNAPQSGSDLVLNKSINALSALGFASYEDIAIADINGDGCAEIFIVATKTEGTQYTAHAFDCEGNSIWATPITFVSNPGLMGLADFDRDGIVELYWRTRIYDAQTGAVLGENNIDNDNTGIHAGVNGWGMNSNAPVAVDIIPLNNNLELVAGCRIYTVSINRASKSATLTLVKQDPRYATRTARTTGSGTSVADFNQDGHLDVLAVGSLGAYNANTTIFFWDVHNNVVKTFSDPIGTGDYKNGWKNGAGRINIADIDGDTLMNAVYVSGKYLYALKEANGNLELLWRENVVEETSGYTGCTTFDLNGDNHAEVIYRDEDYFYIFNTTDIGVVKSPPVRCPSRTHYEYPVVVDVDGDGAAEICVTCSADESTLGKNQQMFAAGEIRVYESANIPWMPARKVWNQHGYMVTNVNDDLTIPRVQQLHHLPYAENAECRQGGLSRPFNGFLNQTTFLSSSGCPIYPVANLTPVSFDAENVIDYTPFVCTDNVVEVSFKYKNIGSVVVNTPINITFYNGDPRLTSPAATRLATKEFSDLQINPGDTATFTAQLDYLSGTIDLYIVINDAGTTAPLDIIQQLSRITECDYNDNIMNAALVPQAVPLVFDFTNNLKCIIAPGVPTTANTGAIEAMVLVDGSPDLTNFTFYWSNGPTPKPLAEIDYTGANYTALPAGVYTVYALHKTRECSSDSVAIALPETESEVDAEMIIDQIIDDENPTGQLSVIVNDADHDGVGDPHNNFTYAWYNGEEVLVGDIIGTSHTLSELGEGTYSVLVQDKTTNCYDTAYATLKHEIVLSADEELNASPVSMYPNPGTDGVTISIENAYTGDVQLQIQSVLGNEVYQTLNSHKNTRTLAVPVDTHKLKSGVYLIKVALGKTSTVYEKWIKL
ncbi:T9SS type A sorting domain-containing protein [Pseudochryseolinea flava]|nr:T9SS type A sorting domain-containing protein [Pseudochryseolinea flava]